MNLEEKDVLNVKLPYITPAIIASIEVETSICAGSRFDGGHVPGGSGGTINDKNDDTSGPGAGGHSDADFGGTIEETDEP